MHSLHPTSIMARPDPAFGWSDWCGCTRQQAREVVVLPDSSVPFPGCSHIPHSPGHNMVRAPSPEALPPAQFTWATAKKSHHPRPSPAFIHLPGTCCPFFSLSRCPTGSPKHGAEQGRKSHSAGEAAGGRVGRKGGGVAMQRSHMLCTPGATNSKAGPGCTYPFA